MTLKEWSELSQIHATSPNERGNVSLTISPTHFHHRSLYHLDDYYVDFMNGPVVWMKPKLKAEITVWAPLDHATMQTPLIGRWEIMVAGPCDAEAVARTLMRDKGGHSAYYVMPDHWNQNIRSNWLTSNGWLSGLRAIPPTQ